MDAEQLDAYLARLGTGRPRRADADALMTLIGRHLATVPFENLSVHRREPIPLDPDGLHDKIVSRRRGGFCYELNGAFAALLTALGYPVTLVAGRVRDDGDFGPPFDHMALIVVAGGRRYLVDVGVGRSPRSPLALDVDGEQPDREGVFAVEHTDDGDVDLRRDGEVMYRLETRPRARDDFRPTCWWHATSPESPFTRALTCSRADGDGRITLADDRLIRTSGDGGKVEETLSSGELLTAYRTWFGIELEQVPEVLHPRPEG